MIYATHKKDLVVLEFHLCLILKKFDHGLELVSSVISSSYSIIFSLASGNNFDNSSERVLFSGSGGYFYLTFGINSTTLLALSMSDILGLL